MKKLTLIFMLLINLIVFGQATLTNCSQTITLKGSAVTDDTQVLSSRPNNNFNYSVSNTVYSWTDDGNNAEKYILIRFDFPQNLVQNSNICEAKLSLYFNPTDPYEPFDFHHLNPDNDNGFIISRITESWNPSQVTWNTKPIADNADQITMNGPSANNQNFLNIDVKTLI